MPTLIDKPTIVAPAGNKPKQIQEYAGRINSGHASVSVARMISPAGWKEPGQRPEFEEITVVLRGMLRVEHEGGTVDVRAGQAVGTAPFKVTTPSFVLTSMSVPRATLSFMNFVLTAVVISVSVSTRTPFFTFGVV